MQTGLKFNFNNNYHVELIDTKTDKVKQSGDFHNIVVNNFKSFLAGTSNVLRGCNIFTQLVVGSGTTPPVITDTSLANELWRTVPSVQWPTTWVDDYTIRKTVQFTFPANASYVGTVTEVGLKNRTGDNYSSDDRVGVMCTRALLTDSEGQQISFVKTDTDILKITVTVEVSISSTSEAFKIFKKARLLRYIIDSTYSLLNREYDAINEDRHGLPQLLRFDRNIEGGNGKDTKVSTNLITTNNSNNDEAYITCSARLANTTVTNQTYYKAVAIPNIGYWSLPNEEIFPAYSITDIPIGTGDGVTTIFENPLNYFKEATDKLYKNGVQLTRGTDYTISNVGNKDCSPEINQMNKVVKVTSNINLSSYTVRVAPLIYSELYTTKPAQQYDALTESPIFNYNNPLYIEYEKSVTLNYIECIGALSTVKPNSSGTSNVPVGTIFYIDYSTDGETYVEAGSTATTKTDGTFMIDFEDKTAKYWRLRTSYNAGSSAVALTESTDARIALTRRQPNIVFTVAPAKDDIITMDVDMDIIMKNSNFVIDLYFRLDFSI